ncbi:hypothetical protein B0F90DRAFT_1818371 [Multifurca ochricompacta]|uniref:Transmembrane protein n=1 Tax=Multifurca ochricompacta TaxID=376703 RepID=A0AAD4QMM0_9AGAM|nr:hypothetical protein B0F90DRAFT_1818371 [Multifurca ochricompacta]
MVNFHDPDVIRADFEMNLSSWDFVTTIGFEWQFISGKRKYRWTLLLYSFSRIGALGNAICNLVGFNVRHAINCQAWITCNLILAYTSFGCASLLIALRVEIRIAIWSHSRLVRALTMGMWLTNVGFLFYGVITTRSAWSEASGGCLLENTFQSRDNITVTVGTDFAQLILMLVGLLRSRQTKYGMFRHLYMQGLIWLAAATLGELPSAVFINLNLNGKKVVSQHGTPWSNRVFQLWPSDPWNLMFQNLALFTMQICATRMYRDLANYNMDVYGTAFQTQPRLRTATNTIPSNRINTTMGSTENWELSLAEKSTAIDDEEAQSHKVSKLFTRDAP